MVVSIVSWGHGLSTGGVRRRHDAGSSARPTSTTAPIATATISRVAPTTMVSVVATRAAASMISDTPPVLR
jgi:hypothetical protein